MANLGNGDSISIRITADASRANKSITALEKNLQGLASQLDTLGAKSSGLMKFSKGVVLLSTAMKTFKDSGVGTADFSRLVKNLGQLSTVDHAGIDATAHSIERMGQAMGNITVLSQNAIHVEEFAKSLSRLGSKGTSQAIDNIPRLGNALSELLTKLAQTPEIRGDLLQMTQAIADFVQGAKSYGNAVRVIGDSSQKSKVNIDYLTQSLQKIGLVMKKVFLTVAKSPFRAFGASVKAVASGISGTVSKLREYGNRVETASEATSKFAIAIGTLYVKFWLLIRVLSKFWSAIKKSFDYLETVNYFNSAFEAIADKAVKTMGEAGEESAQAYYDEYTKRAKSLTEKMTGFVIDGGNLQMSKGANLGLDPQTTLNYQATFAQIANSMGVASDKAVTLSTVLTEIGADLASVKNMEFEDVWQNMASALVGMSRAVDKFGINIRASAMDEKLLELGINATSKELSQADKALLRTIMILDSSRYAWKDLAETLEAPANQIRMLTANLHKLATMFGSLFLPILKKILPYINAVVIALQRLMQTIANALHIDLSGMLKSGGGSNEALSDILDESEQLDDNLEDATDQAKKLKNNLLGIDELNIINENQQDDNKLDDLGISGLLDDAFLDAVSEYQSAWDEAFSKLQNKAQEIADRIVEWAKKVWKPIGEAWDAVGDEVIDKWEYMTGELGKLFKDIARDWATVWAQDATEEIFENILLSVSNIFELVGNLAKQFRQAWNEGDKGLHILETMRDIIKIVSEHVRDMTQSWADWAGTLDFNPILESILKFLTAIKEKADDILGIFDDFQEMFLQPTLKYALEEFFPQLLDIFTRLALEIKWDKLRLALQDLWEGLAILAQVLGNGLLDLLNKLADIIIEFVNGDYIKNFTRDFKELANALKDAEDINDVINALFDFADGRAIDATKIINAISRAFNDALEKVDWKNLGHRIGEFINKFVLNLDTASLGKNVSNIAMAFFQTIHGALEKVKWYELGKKIGEFLGNIDWLGILTEVWGIVKQVAKGLIETWAGSFSESPVATTILTAIAGIFVGGKLYNFISKATGGKGLFGDILSKLFGGNDKMSEENGLFDKIFGSAKKASDSKNLFADANGRVAESAEKSNGLLKYELQYFAETESKAGTIAKTLGGVGAVLGGSAMAIGGFIKQWNEGFSALGALITGVGIAIAGVGAVILGAPAAVVAAVGAIVFAIAEGIVLIHEHWDEIKAWWEGTVVPAVSGFFEGIGEKFKEFGEGIGEAWEGFKTTISQKWEELKTGFSTFVEEWGVKIQEWASQKWEAITDKVEEIRGKIEQKWGEIKENFSTHIQNWQTQITEWASSKWEDITNKLEEIRSGIQTKWEEMQQNFTDHIGEWHNRITQWASERWEEITNKVAEVRDYIQDRWGEMKQHFEEHIKNWRDSITEWATSKWDEITSTMDTIKGEIYDRWQLMKEDFDEFKDRWREKIVEWASEKWDAITDAMSELRGNIQEKWENFKTDFTTFIGEWQGKIAEWASEKWDSVVETITTLRDGIKRNWDEIHQHASDFWGKFKTDLGTWAKNSADAVSNAFKGIKDSLSDAWGNIKSGAEKAFDSVKTTATNTWNNIKDTVSNVTSAISGSTSLSSSLTKTSTSTSKSSVSSSYKTTSLFDADNWKKLFNADGGFPEDGLFFANHSELVGKFSNGKTAVANNQQITDGIAQATYQAMMRANADSSTNEEDLLRELISAVKQGSRVVIDGREIVTAYDTRKARNGYAF